MSLALALLGAVNDYYFANSELDKVYEYLLEIEVGYSAATTIIFGIIAFISIVLWLISIIGLLVFKPISKPLYLISFILLVLITPFMGISVASGISQVLYDLSMAISGAMLALIYFSPVEKYFKKT